MRRRLALASGMKAHSAALPSRAVSYRGDRIVREEIDTIESGAKTSKSTKLRQRKWYLATDAHSELSLKCYQVRVMAARICENTRYDACNHDVLASPAVRLLDATLLRYMSERELRMSDGCDRGREIGATPCS